MDLDKIEQVAADILNVTAEDMHTRTRKREVVWARQIIIYYCLSFHNWDIGNHYQKHRTTVHYISKKVPEMIEYDKEYARLWNEMLTALGHHQSDLEKKAIEDLCNNVSFR